MANNLAININLLNEAYKISGVKTKKDTVNIALKEYIQHHKQKEILKYFGKVDFDKDYDYTKQRNRY